MTGALFDSGFETWHDWETAPRQWLLLNDDFVGLSTWATVADIAADEITASGYTREPLTDPVSARSAAINDLHYGATGPEFAGMAPGQIIAMVVLAREGATDADSALIGMWSLNQTTDVGKLTLAFPAWQDRLGNPLPDGTAGTGLIHVHSDRSGSSS